MSKTYAQLVEKLYSDGAFTMEKGHNTVKEILDAFEEGHCIIDEQHWSGLDADDSNGENETPVNYDEDDLQNGVDTEEQITYDKIRMKFKKNGNIYMNKLSYTY